MNSFSNMSEENDHLFQERIAFEDLRHFHQMEMAHINFLQQHDHTLIDDEWESLQREWERHADFLHELHILGDW